MRTATEVGNAHHISVTFSTDHMPDIVYYLIPVMQTQV